MERGEAIGVRLAQRDERALEDAYAAYASTLLAYLGRYVGRDEAEDVMQRTFLDAWRHAPRSASAGGCSRSPTAAPSTPCGRGGPRWSTWRRSVTWWGRTGGRR